MSALSPFRESFLHGFVASLDIVGIKLVEDLKIFFETSADLSIQNGSIEDALRSLRGRVRIGMKVIGETKLCRSLIEVPRSAG